MRFESVFHLIAALCAVLPFVASGSLQFGGAEINLDGSFIYEGQLFKLVHWDDMWNPAAQDSGQMAAEPGYPKIKDGTVLFSGYLRTRAGDILVLERFLITEEGKLAVEVTLSAKHPISTNLVALVIPLREEIWKGKSVRLDGKEIGLPEKYRKLSLFSKKKFKSFDLWGADGTHNLRLTSSGALELQDSRKFPYVHEYNVRLHFIPNSGKLEKAGLAFILEKLDIGSEPVDIRTIVNRGFKDEVPGDGKGGWTDQGPDNDLSEFPTGPVKLGGINFDIINPDENGGKSCMVFQNGNLDRVELPMNGRRIPYLCVLQAFAWVMGDMRCHVGDIEAVYTDGTVSRFPVVNTRDGNDWWTPVPVQNGRLVWRGQNKTATVGLFLASFKLHDKPVKTLAFIPQHPRVWMIAGLSVANSEPSPAFSEPPLVFQPGKIWRELKWSREIEPGSILDFSGQLEAPAGKYGRVITGRNGVWTFRDRSDVPVRFYGVNLSAHGGFPDKKTAELAAERFAAYGINAVRIHHHDNILTGGGRNSSELAPEWIDRLDYFFHCLKKRGIYLITDLYASRTMPAGAVPGISHAVGMNEWKGLVMVNSDVKENHKRFVRNWLEHVNPYTGIAWKDDPALIAATNVNEGNFDHWLKESSEETRRMFDRGFEEWRNRRPAGKKEKKDNSSLRLAYLAELHHDFYLEMREFVRSLGTELLLTDLNMGKTPWNSMVRDAYDFADNHFYVEHPTGILPFRLENVSMIGKFGGPLIGMIPGRRGGKPFTITEFNWVFPSRFRAESGVLTGAYAALQDWSGLWRYTYSHPEKTLSEISVPVTFDFHSDPINLLSDRIGRLLFVRGDVSPAQVGVKIILPDCCPLPDQYPELLEQLGLICRVESVSGQSDADDSSRQSVTLSANGEGEELSVYSPDFLNRLSILPEFGKNVLLLKEGIAHSVTGELELNCNQGSFRVVTPRSEVLVHSVPGKLNGKLLKSIARFENSVVSLSSMDGAPLTKSKRMLILHLTDVMNTGGTFADSARQIYIAQGELPLLGRYGCAELELDLGDGDFELYAVDFSGRRIGMVPVRLKQGRLSFSVDTFQFEDHVVFAYELLRK